MKTLIIYQSFHHHNTEKIIRYIADRFPVDLLKISEITSESVKDYDRIGFASGVYFFKPHRLFLEKVPNLKLKNKDIFLITTSGMRSIPIFANYHKSFKSLFEKAGLNIVSWFETRGYDTYPIFVRPLGGINKNRPNQKDFNNALQWYKKLNEHEN